jgi:hypothetical protein
MVVVTTAGRPTGTPTMVMARVNSRMVTMGLER